MTDAARLLDQSALLKLSRLVPHPVDFCAAHLPISDRRLSDLRSRTSAPRPGLRQQLMTLAATYSTTGQLPTGTDVSSPKPGLDTHRQSACHETTCDEGSTADRTT